MYGSLTGSPPPGRVDADYTISYVAGTLDRDPAALTITANNQARSMARPCRH